MSGSSTGGWRDPWLWGALALAFALRAFFVALYPSIHLWFDEMLHYVWGVITAEVGIRAISRWGPGYEVFQAWVYSLAGPTPVAVRWAQVGVSTASVGLVYGIARRAGGARAGRIAAWGCALYPSLIAYAHYLYYETLFIALFLGAVYCLFRAPGLPGRGDAVAAGLLFGLASLVRGVAIYFLPLWVVWLAAGRRWPEMRRAALVCAVALATVLPWTLRNAVEYRGFQFIDQTAGLSAWWAYNTAPYANDLGYHRGGERKNRDRCDAVSPHREPLPRAPKLRAAFPPDEALDARTAARLPTEIHLVRSFSMLDGPVNQRCELDNALEFVRENPGVALDRILQRGYIFFGPNSFLLRSVYSRGYPDGPLARSHYAEVKWAVVASYVAVGLLAILGFALHPLPPVAGWILLFTGYFTAIHLLAVAASRYRLPLEPLWIAVASLWLARPRWPDGPWRALAVAAASAAFLVLSAHYLWVRLP